MLFTICFIFVCIVLILYRPKNDYEKYTKALKDIQKLPFDCYILEEDNEEIRASLRDVLNRKFLNGKESSEKLSK